MNQRVIDALNEAREHELQAIAQYMVHHYELEDRMYGKLGDVLKRIAIVEMKHAEEFAERVLFLGGVPTSKPSIDPATGIRKKQTVEELLAFDEELESGAVKLYNDLAKVCADEGDHVSKQLFERIAKEEEGHLDEFQNILAFVRELGPVYLATLTGEAEG